MDEQQVHFSLQVLGSKDKETSTALTKGAESSLFPLVYQYIALPVRYPVILFLRIQSRKITGDKRYVNIW